jgi:hypothetical protein
MDSWAVTSTFCSAVLTLQRFYQRFLRIFQCQYCLSITENYCVGTGTIESFFCAFLLIIFACLFEVVEEFLRMAASKRKLSLFVVDLLELAFHFFILESIIPVFVFTHVRPISVACCGTYPHAKIICTQFQVYKSTYETTISISFRTTIQWRTVNMKVKYTNFSYIYISVFLQFNFC